MFRYLSVLAFVFLQITKCVYGQYNKQDNFLKANSVWAFGYRSGYDFNQRLAFETEVKSVLASASVADTLGRLLFYIGSDTIYNANHLPMLNGTGILPNMPKKYGQHELGVLIVPMIDSTNKYFVFTKGVFDNANSQPPLSYSVVDMTLDNGLGAVDSARKNVPLDTLHVLQDPIIAVPGDNCDIWVVTHTDNYYRNPSDTPRFKTWHITAYGIEQQPVYSPVNPLIRDLLAQYHFSKPRIVGYGAGNMAVSPDRKKIAMTTRGDYFTGIIYGRFDPVYGIVDDFRTLKGTQEDGTRGVCFSPDASKLYFTSLSAIEQFDVSSNNEFIMNNKKRTIHVKVGEFAAWSKILFGMSALKLYNDTIYGLSNTNILPGDFANRSSWLYTQYHSKSLLRINRPNESGSASDFEDKALLLHQRSEAFQSLPNEVVYPVIFYTRVNHYDTMCLSQEGLFEPSFLKVAEGFNHYVWDNGEEGHERLIDKPGRYWVSYQTTHCDRYIDTFYVEALDLRFTLGKDTSLLFCPIETAPLTLSVSRRNARFLWQDGSTKSRYDIEKPGTYWLEVQQAGCRFSDTIKIDGIEFDYSLGDDLALCEDGQPIYILLAEGKDLPEGMLMLTSHSAAGQPMIARDTGTYWVRYYMPPCIFSDTIKIERVVCSCVAQLPNAFSPNNDGLNDVFQPLIRPDCRIKNYLLKVYNRYGQLIFQSTNPALGWTGNNGGGMAGIGTYFFELSFVGGTEEHPFYQKGEVILIR